VNNVRLWTAIHEQAQAWAAVPECQAMAQQLPRNRTRAGNGLPGYLQELQAGGAFLGSRPLRAGRLLPWWMDGMPTPITDVVQAELAAWSPTVQAVEEAHRLTVAWLRSRMPGYPMLPAPQLAPGAPWTTNEFTWRLGWAPDERAQGLQYLSEPEAVADWLEVSPDHQRRLDGTARAVADALGGSEEWQRLAAARRDLDREARQALSQARAAIRRRLTEESVDAHEPRLAIRRAQYREAVVNEELGDLRGAAHEYATAFDRAEGLIQLAASDVFGQLLMYGDPQTVHPDRVEFDGDGEVRMGFSSPELIGGTTGALLWVDDPLVSDAVRVEELRFSLDHTSTELVRCAAVMLSGTGQAWAGA
jgi:hypothetical protein